MTIFAVIEQPDPNTVNLPPFILREFPKDNYALGSGVWLISFSGTAIELAGKLELKDGGRGAAVILAVSNYFGFASLDIWEWLKSKMEKSSGG